jgi:penicillin-binding protein 1C
VSLASDVGVPDLLRFLRRAGLSTFDRTAAYYGLGLTLGNAEVRLDELVAAYSAFATGGEWRRPTYVIDSNFRLKAEATSQDSQAEASSPQESQLLFSPRTAFWITDILADDNARAYIFGRGSSLELPFPVAVKTGTSQAYHDNWTIGFTRRLTVGVWVGNFDRRPLRNSSGVTGAAPIFQAVMLAAHKRAGEADDTLPVAGPGLEQREICSLSGEAANAWCPVRRREWLPVEHETVPCSWHHLSEPGLLTFWPPEFREWAGRRASRVDSPGAVPTAGQVREPAVRRVSSAAVTPVFRMANPPTGATYLIDPTLRPEFQTLALRVVSASPTRVEWSINGNAAGISSSESALEWRLKPGQHHIVARDRRGNVAESVVTVR